jgi:hypothetical protein
MRITFLIYIYLKSYRANTHENLIPISEWNAGGIEPMLII